jgi:hypothetical protein
MSETRYTALEWATMEGGHDIETSLDSAFSFLKGLHEARITKDNGSSQRLTYTDCGERMYLMLLTLETMRQYPDFKAAVQSYCRKTSGFELYKFYRIMGTDLYNFVYFLVGNDSAQNKLKDPEAAKALKARIRLPVAAINRYISEIAQGKQPTLVTKLFLSIESALNITNSDYKDIRRGLQDYTKLNLQQRQRLVTRLIFAVRAKLRSSDIIDDFEKFAALKNLETDSVTDPEPTVSTPDIRTGAAEIALYRYLVGAKNLAQTKRFLDMAKDGKAVSGDMLRAYLPVVKMIDDIVQSGPAYVQQLRTLHQRAQKRR